MSEPGEAHQQTLAELQQQQHESEERLRLMVAVSKAGWWHWDLDDNKITVDSQVKAIFAAGDDEVSFEVFLSRLAPNEEPAIMERFAKALQDPADFDSEFHLIWPDGSHHWVLGRGRGFCDESGRLRRLMGWWSTSPSTNGPKPNGTVTGRNWRTPCAWPPWASWPPPSRTS